MCSFHAAVAMRVGYYRNLKVPGRRSSIVQRSAHAELQDGVTRYTLLDLTTSITKHQERQWGFPKGGATSVQATCAGVYRRDGRQLHGITGCVEEQFVRSNGVTYCFKYFLAAWMRAAPY
jgi:hypothetical protein